MSNLKIVMLEFLFGVLGGNLIGKNYLRGQII
jgi:hypothetical protein